ncbi:MAG: Rpn family recombination-promoting nuclease/putative transposase, partial [Clostridiales bacterium]|nr:Rpn family recombination-promoting nuclease/putative transposase [Clostridiales bacterium]
PRESKDSKGSSIDIVCKVESGEFILVQMQEESQDFIAARTEMEAAKLPLTQFSASDGEPKSTVTFKSFKKIYTVVIMLESPREFKETMHFLHRCRQVDILSPRRSFEPMFNMEFCFVELEKFMDMFGREDLYALSPELMELGRWLRFLGDHSAGGKKALAGKDPEFAAMLKEVTRMSMNRNELYKILSQEVDEILRQAEINDAKREAEERAERAEAAVAESKAKAEAAVAEAKAKAEVAAAEAAEAKAKAEVAAAEAEAKAAEAKAKAEAAAAEAKAKAEAAAAEAKAKAEADVAKAESEAAEAKAKLKAIIDAARAGTLNAEFLDAAAL